MQLCKYNSGRGEDNVYGFQGMRPRGVPLHVAVTCADGASRWWPPAGDVSMCERLARAWWCRGPTRSADSSNSAHVAHLISHVHTTLYHSVVMC